MCWIQHWNTHVKDLTRSGVLFFLHHSAIIPGVDGKECTNVCLSSWFPINCSCFGAAKLCSSKGFGSTFSFSASACNFFSNSIVSSPVNERDLLCTCLINCACTSGGKSWGLPPPSNDPPFPCSANSSGGMLGSFFLDLRVVESLTDVMIKSLLWCFFSCGSVSKIFQNPARQCQLSFNRKKNQKINDPTNKWGIYYR